MKAKVSRKAHFNAAHRLFRSDWDDQKNLEVFGKCSNPNYHGHNYDLVVSVTGDIDPQTGFVMDMKVLKDLIRKEIEDHIAGVIWKRLRPHIEPSKELEVTLFETERNFVTYTG